MDYDVLLKLVIVGESGVGKSCLLLRFSENAFRSSEIATIGVDFKIKTIEMDDKIIKLQIWDTAGQERFATITSAYYRGSHGILIAYDVTRRESFDRVQKWVNQVNVWAPDQTQILLIANKTDLPNRTVSVEEGQELAERLGCQIVETSAKDDVNVDLMFETIVKEILKTGICQSKPQGAEENAFKVVNTSKSKKNFKKCC